MTTVRIDNTDFGHGPAQHEGFFSHLVALDGRFRERRALEALGAERLSDIGLSASDVERELVKPFWRP
jgi:uncharacterized protein YjiS (DUF1127 family)